MDRNGPPGAQSGEGNNRSARKERAARFALAALAAGQLAGIVALAFISTPYYPDWGIVFIAVLASIFGCGAMLICSRPEAAHKFFGNLAAQGWYRMRTMRARLNATERTTVSKWKWIALAVVSAAAAPVFVWAQWRRTGVGEALQPNNIAGILLYIAMLGLLVYVLIRCKREAISERHAVTTWLIYQNMILSVVLAA